MTSKAASVEQQLQEIPLERQPFINKLRQTILANIPSGFVELNL